MSLSESDRLSSHRLREFFEIAVEWEKEEMENRKRLAEYQANETIARLQKILPKGRRN